MLFIVFIVPDQTIKYVKLQVNIVLPSIKAHYVFVLM